MQTTLKHEYKGYGIELSPREEFCSSFAVEVRDPGGNVISYLKAGGDVEDKAVERGREAVDFDLAYKSRQT